MTTSTYTTAPYDDFRKQYNKYLVFKKIYDFLSKDDNLTEYVKYIFDTDESDKKEDPKKNIQTELISLPAGVTESDITFDWCNSKYDNNVIVIIDLVLNKDNYTSRTNLYLRYPGIAKNVDYSVDGSVLTIKIERD